MLSVVRMQLLSEIPIVGCELTPYVLLRRPDGSITTEDIQETTPLDGYYVKYVWYQIQSDKKVSVCSVHPSVPATIQCLGCIKVKVPLNKSFHCSAKCFSDSWKNHQSMHMCPTSGTHGNGTNDDELFGRFGSTGNTLSTALNGGCVLLGSTQVSERNGGEIWYEVGYKRTYTPTSDDVGYVLKLECTVVDVNTRKPVSPPSTLLTSRVILAPLPIPRRMVSLIDGGVGTMDLDNGRTSSTGTFTVLSYNILADIYASGEKFGYCPSWALSWTYRRQNLLREIVGYQADILCLQEVQSDHFDEFFVPELDKYGYTAVYKKKTTEMYTGSAYAIDGCATFFRRDRFSLVKKYEVEFNKAAQSLTESAFLAVQKKAALSRLLKDNVALIVVLEAKDIIHGTDLLSAPVKRQLLCVANTHIHANPELKDVKLWQVHTLLKGLEKIAASADIPMLVCGDFNSVPSSAPHMLLASGRVDPLHPDLAVDPIGILRPPSKLCHHLPLASAYSAFGQLNLHDSQIDPNTNEPFFTNCTRDFIGTLDYIFFTVDSLTVVSLLELLDEERLRKDTALPSPEWSSDHIALLAEFHCKPRMRR